MRTTATGRAVVSDTYGSTDVLELRQLPIPVAGDEEVLVRVKAAGTHAGDWHLMAGLPYLVRIMGFGLRAPKSRVRGDDFAGQIEAVGRNVTGFQVGDQVYGVCDGAFAEYAVARPHRIAPKPVNLTFEQASVVPSSGITALQGLRDTGRLEPGQRVLVIGAGGGVGSFAVQVAKALGGHVTGVCSTGKVDVVRSIGADEVIDYTTGDFAESGRFDLIVDTAGRRPLSHLRRALAPHGTLVIVGGDGGGRWFGGTGRQLRGLLISPFLGQRLTTLMATVRKEDLEEMTRLIEQGTVTPVIDRTYPLSQTPDAIRYLAEGHASGKVAIVI